jgi:hypothetical protein
MLDVVGQNVKTTSKVAGGILVLLGTVWFLQGINVLPGSFMTGQVRWAVYGGIAFVAGIALLLVGYRRKHTQGPGTPSGSSAARRKP